jgi:hypothetical protein
MVVWATGVLAVGAAAALPTLSPAAGMRVTARACSFPLEAIRNRLPAASSEPFDPAITAMFAVLRRPSLPQDLLAPINPLGEDLSYQLRSYFPGEIRLLEADAEGDHYFLVPGFERGFPVPPARCLPKSLRRRHAQLVAEQRRREVDPVYCIEDVGPRRPRYVVASCQPFSAIQSGERLVATAASRSEVIELAPDGVAGVRLLYRGGSVINAAVTSNSYRFTPPQRLVKAVAVEISHLVARTPHPSERQRVALERSFFKRAERLAARLIPESVLWLDAAGNTIRSFRPSSRFLAVLGPLISSGSESSNAEGGFSVSSG